jgi:hypothetical protein
MKDYVKDVTPEGMDFAYVGCLVDRFLRENRSESLPEWRRWENNSLVIPVDGYWGGLTELAYAYLVMDFDQERLLIRKLPPTIGVNERDTIEHWENFCERFEIYTDSLLNQDTE